MKASYRHSGISGATGASPEDQFKRQYLEEHYVRQRMTQHDVGQLLGWSTAKVSRTLRRLGIPVNKRARS